MKHFIFLTIVSLLMVCTANAAGSKRPVSLDGKCTKLTVKSTLRKTMLQNVANSVHQALAPKLVELYLQENYDLEEREVVVSVVEQFNQLKIKAEVMTDKRLLTLGISTKPLHFTKSIRIERDIFRTSEHWNSLGDLTSYDCVENYALDYDHLPTLKVVNPTSKLTVLTLDPTVLEGTAVVRFDATK